MNSNRKPKVRNPVAMSPLLRKGGAHIPSKTGLRTQAKLAAYDEYYEWLNEQEATDNKRAKARLLFGIRTNTDAIQLTQ